MTNETNDMILKIIGAILAFFTFRWVIKIFSREDGKKGMSKDEFLKLAAFVLFFGGIIFMLIIEGLRTTEYHIFDPIWVAFFITGLFSVLHMTDVLDKMSKFLELLIRLKTKMPPPTENTEKTPE